MIAIVAVLLALPLGFFVRSRLAATTAYAVAYLWAFTFQTLYLLLESLDPSSTSEPAFTAGDFPVAYGAVTLGVFALGFGLLALGRRVGVTRRHRRGPVVAPAVGEASAG